MPDWAIALLSAGVPIVIFVGGLFIRRRGRLKGEEREKLRTHFEELKSKIGDAMMNVPSHFTERYGKVGLYNTMIRDWVPISNTLGSEMGEQFDSFSQHFTEEAAKWKELCGRINGHNGEHDRFKQAIEQAFAGFPFISKIDFEVFFTRWEALADNRRPWPDFQQIEVRPCQEGYAVYASGRESSAVVWGTTEDKEKYKLAFNEVVENKEYQKKAAKIHVSALELVARLKEFANELSETMNEITRYWPNKRFDRLVDCPICKKL